MKKQAPAKKKQRRAAFRTILAVIFVFAAGLTVCYFFQPSLFQRLTQPVLRTAQAWFAPEEPEPPPEPVSEPAPPPEAVAEPEEETVEQVVSEPVEAPPFPVSDPIITDRRMQNGIDILTGGIVPVTYFNQGEEPWANQRYGSDPISGYGCGPTAMAMAIASLTGEAVDPAQMADLACEKGYWARRSGSSHAIVGGLAEEYGLTVTALAERTPAAVQRELLSGNLLVALMGPGHFTSKGHFILLRGVTLNGTILVADPNSEERSLTEWDAQLILDELSHSKQHGAPIWVVSKPR